MTPKKLHKLKKELASYRWTQARADDLESLAKRLGRKQRRGKRSKEPFWESVPFPELPPLAIPHHGGRDLAPGTRRSILDQLEEDVLAWEVSVGEGTEDDNSAE